jgi:hypothetical protein
VCKPKTLYLFRNYCFFFVWLKDRDAEIKLTCRQPRFKSNLNDSVNKDVHCCFEGKFLRCLELLGAIQFTDVQNFRLKDLQIST